jgi:hypothetical protein
MHDFNNTDLFLEFSGSPSALPPEPNNITQERKNTGTGKPQELKWHTPTILWESKSQELGKGSHLDCRIGKCGDFSI